MLGRILLLICLPFQLFCIGEEPHHTTAFIDLPGSLDSLLSFSSYSTSSFWNKNGQKRDAFNHFRKKSCNLYSEYAFNGCDSVYFNGSYSHVKESLHGNSCGFEDFELGWKHMLQGTDTSAFTGELVGIIPSGEKKSSLRYGRAGLQAGILYSKVFRVCKKLGWTDLGLNYRYYTGFPSDQLRFLGTIGYYFATFFKVIATVNLQYGLFNGKSRHNLNNLAFHPNYRLLKTKIECSIDVLDNVGLSLGAYAHIWGENIGRGGGYFAGLWVDF